jgi:transcriptional regulator
MLTPDHFRPADGADAWDVMRRHGFATLVTSGADGAPVAAPLAFLVRPHERRLVSHLSRRNPQVRQLAAGTPALVVFQGPSAFVSGSSYAEAPAVPTWNHLTVHVTGRAALQDDETVTLRVLEETVAHFEQLAGTNWRLDAGHAAIRGWAREVVAFAVEAERVETQFKLSQNLPAHQRAEVAARLRAAGATDVVAAMERTHSAPARS